MWLNVGQRVAVKHEHERENATTHVAVTHHYVTLQALKLDPKLSTLPPGHLVGGRVFSHRAAGRPRCPADSDAPAGQPEPGRSDVELRENSIS